MSVFSITCLVSQFIIIFVILVSNIIELEATQRNCSSPFDCPNQACCTVSFNPLIKICDDNCVGRACRADYHCYDYRECCDGNTKVCTDDFERCGCTDDDSICGRQGKVCCKARASNRVRVCREKCKFHPCSSDKDCAYGECCNIHDKCASKCSLKKCKAVSDCSYPNDQKCCDYKLPFPYKSELIKVCLYKCPPRIRYCSTDENCADLGQCCGSDQRCTNCSNGYSWKKFLILGSVIMFLVICSVFVVTCYCRRKGQCILFKPRVQEDSVELQELNVDTVSGENVFPVQNLPPPPYSMTEQPFPPSQNQEFPPAYS